MDFFRITDKNIGTRCRVQGTRYRVQGTGYKVQGIKNITKKCDILQIRVLINKDTSYG